MESSQVAVEALLKKTTLKPITKRFAPNGAGAVLFESRGDNGIQAEKDAKEAKKLLDGAGFETNLQELSATGKWRVNIRPTARITVQDLKRGLNIFQPAHPEYGIWFVVRKYDEGVWEIGRSSRPSDQKVAFEDELIRFWQKAV